MSKSNVTEQQRRAVDEKILNLERIVRSINFWLSSFDTDIPIEVGAVIHAYALRELFFIDYLYKRGKSMGTLKAEALKRLKEIKPPVTEVHWDAHKCKEVSEPKKSRLTELSEMEAKDLAKIEMELVKKKTLADMKTELIRSILKLEKEGYSAE